MTRIWQQEKRVLLALPQAVPNATTIGCCHGGLAASDFAEQRSPRQRQCGVHNDPQGDACTGFEDHGAGGVLDVMYSMGYNSMMIEIRESYDFVEYMRDLRDVNAKVRIAQRIRRLALGNPGDVRAVGEGISELRVDYGPGYRVYYKRRGEVLIIVLCAGDKRSQDSDISRAKQIANELETP